MPTDGRPGIARPLLDRVDRELKLNGRTKAWLSRETGLARSTIDRLGTIKEAPQSATVVKIADALGIDRIEALHLAGVLSRASEAEPGDVVSPELRARIDRILARPPLAARLEDLIDAARLDPAEEDGGREAHEAG